MKAALASPPLFGWPIWVSVAAHAAGIVVAPSIVALAPADPPTVAVPIEVVRIEPPEPPKPSPRPQASPPRPTMESRPVARAAPMPRDIVPPVPLNPAPLFEDSPQPPSASRVSEAAGPTSTFLAAANRPPSLPSLPSGGGPPGVGGLFSTGDLPVMAGVGSNAGGEGLTEFARPIGGYQTKPRYPDAARRQGIEGVTTLRFEVLATGRVGSIVVAQSSGHPDLDQAAVGAVSTWLFTPARRGKEPVRVWVVLPVRFRLE